MENDLLMIFSKIDDKNPQFKNEKEIKTNKIENFLKNSQNEKNESKIEHPVYKLKNYKTLKERILEKLEKDFYRKSKNLDLKNEHKMMNKLLEGNLKYEFLEEKFVDKKLLGFAKEAILNNKFYN